MNCKECGEEISKEARFCPFCGAVIKAPSSDDYKGRTDQKVVKEPVFKTSKKTPESPEKIKARSIKQKLIDVIVVILIIVIASGMVAYRVITIRNSKKLFSMAAYVKNGILYLDTDITSENDVPIPVSKTSYSLIEYGFDKTIAAFSDDCKILYYMDKDTGDGSGRLEKVMLNRLTDDLDDNSQNAEKVADFVISYTPLENSTVLYETNEMELCYYDGKNTRIISEEVASYFLSYSGNYVYMLEGDEQGMTFELSRASLNSKASKVVLADDVEKVITSLNSDAVMFTVKEDDGTDDLYLVFDNKEAVVIGEDIYYAQYCSYSNGVFYSTVDDDDIMSLYYYDQKSSSRTCINNISSLNMQSGICMYQKADADTWYYMLAGGDEQVFDCAYDYDGKDVWSSLDGRYVMVTVSSEDEQGDMVVAFRSTDGTLSSDKLITQGGSLGASTGTTIYYLDYNQDDDTIDLCSFHNNRTKVLAKDVSNDSLVTAIYSTDNLLVLYNTYDLNLSIYKDGENRLLVSDVQKLIYAGKNAAVYVCDSECYISYLDQKEIKTVLICDDVDAIVVPEKSTVDGYVYGN